MYRIDMEDSLIRRSRGEDGAPLTMIAQNLPFDTESTTCVCIKPLSVGAGQDKSQVFTFEFRPPSLIVLEKTKMRKYLKDQIKHAEDTLMKKRRAGWRFVGLDLEDMVSFSDEQIREFQVKYFAFQAARGNPDFLQFLQHNRENPNLKEILKTQGPHMPLHEAIAHGHMALARELVGQLDSEALALEALDTYTTAHWAASEGNTEVAIAIANKMTPANLALQTQDRYTALHLAAIEGELAIVEAIVEQMNPADLALQDDIGYTALHWAVQEKHEAISTILILDNQVFFANSAKMFYYFPL